MMSPSRMPRRYASLMLMILTCFWLFAFGGSSAQAERLLQGRIENHGQTVFESRFAVSDSTGSQSLSAIWMALGESEFEKTASFTATPDPTKPFKLEGGVRVVVSHRNDLIAAAEVPELILIPSSGDGETRKISREDVLGTAEAAGITLSSLYLVSRTAVLTTILAIIAVACAMAYFAMARKRKLATNATLPHPKEPSNLS